MDSDRAPGSFSPRTMPVGKKRPTRSSHRFNKIRTLAGPQRSTGGVDRCLSSALGIMHLSLDDLHEPWTPTTSLDIISGRHRPHRTDPLRYSSKLRIIVGSASPRSSVQISPDRTQDSLYLSRDSVGCPRATPSDRQHASDDT